MKVYQKSYEIILLELNTKKMMKISLLTLLISIFGLDNKYLTISTSSFSIACDNAV